MVKSVLLIVGMLLLLIVLYMEFFASVVPNNWSILRTIIAVVFPLIALIYITNRKKKNEN